MKRDASNFDPVRFSVRVYRALLILYPADYRREYGDSMAQLFRDLCRDAVKRDGVWGLVVWWMAALLDLLQSVIAERRKVDISMSKAKFIQLSGWLLILGGLFFLVTSALGHPSVQYRLADYYSLLQFSIAPGMALVMFGLIGMYLRFNPQMNLFGKLALLTAIIGAGVGAVGWFLMLVVYNGWIDLFMVGWMVHLAGTSVFGGFAVTTKLLPKWNFALLIGSAMPLTVVLYMMTLVPSMKGGTLPVYLLISASWILTGSALNSTRTVTIQPATV